MPPKTRRGSVAVAVAEPTAELSNGSEEGVIDEVVDRVIVAVRIRPLSRKELDSGAEPCAITQGRNSIVICKKAQKGAVLKSQQRHVNEYCFDEAFGETSTQDEVYQATAAKHIPAVLEGSNVTVIAYGATGAGKTHTMMGSTRRDAATVAGTQVNGIIPQALVDIFEGLSAKETERMAWRHAVMGPPCDGGRRGVNTSVHIQYCEVYNESVFDLLRPSQASPTPLRVMEDPLQGVVCVHGLTELPARSPGEVLALLESGNANRTTEATAANETSSRSHAILWVTVREEWPGGPGDGGVSGSSHGSSSVGVSFGHGAHGTMKRRDARLSLIDLAGSERASATLNSGARLHEGAKINRSLLALANCINALTASHSQAGAATKAGANNIGGAGNGGNGTINGVAAAAASGGNASNNNNSTGRTGVRRGSTGSEPRGSLVNYRDSKLTHLLKSSLEGRCRMIMIANVNPNAAFYEDSHNTIKYADRAKAIKVKANTINNVTSTSTGVQNGNSSKPGGGGSRTPMHQLRQKLGDTEASREKLEEELRSLRAAFAARDACTATYVAPPAQQVLLESQEMMATGGSSAGDSHGHSQHHHTNNHTAANPSSTNTIATTGTAEAERGKAASALAAARSPWKARLWNERRYAESTTSQDSVAGDEECLGGLTASIGGSVSEHASLPKRRHEDTRTSEDIASSNAPQAAKRPRGDGVSEHHSVLDASLVSFSEESYAPPPYPPPPPPPPPPRASHFNNAVSSSTDATVAASAMVATAVSSAVAAAVAKSSARELELIEQCNALELARMQAVQRADSAEHRCAALEKQVALLLQHQQEQQQRGASRGQTAVGVGHSKGAESSDDVDCSGGKASVDDDDGNESVDLSETYAMAALAEMEEANAVTTTITQSGETTAQNPAAVYAAAEAMLATPEPRTERRSLLPQGPFHRLSLAAAAGSNAITSTTPAREVSVTSAAASAPAPGSDDATASTVGEPSPAPSPSPQQQLPLGGACGAFARRGLTDLSNLRGGLGMHHHHQASSSSSSSAVAAFCAGKTTSMSTRSGKVVAATGANNIGECKAASTGKVATKCGNRSSSWTRSSSSAVSAGKASTATSETGKTEPHAFLRSKRWLRSSTANTPLATAAGTTTSTTADTVAEANALLESLQAEADNRGSVASKRARKSTQFSPSKVR